MSRAFKLCILVALSWAAVQRASAFVVIGNETGEAYQVPEIGYQSGGQDLWGVDIASPRNFPEEYRWNTPILYYAFDSTFADFFGSNGVVAVQQTMNIFNALSNVSSYSQQLTEFPRDSTRVNLRAQTLYLLDLKSITLKFLLEELGLGSGERWSWCLHDRAVSTPPGCPNGVTYQVIKRNYDPVTFEPSSFVNGTLFSYFIVDICNGPPPIISDAYEFPVDPLAPSTGVAAQSLFQTEVGAFYTGLSRDDFGGLRYLWRTNNMNVEFVDSAATPISTTATNGSTEEIIVTSDLRSLLEAATTNAPAQLQALFPDVMIADSSSAFQLVVTSNTVSYFTNYPWSPAGTAATLVTATNLTTNVQQRFTYSFANVVTNTYFTNGIITTVTTNLSIPPFGLPTDPLQTNVTTQSRSANFINGDYYVIPTNACNYQVLSNLFTQVTNISTTVTATNATATNVSGQTLSITTTTYATNHFLLVRNTPCSTNAFLRMGMEKIRFVQANYDSLLGQLFTPVTTNYTLNGVSGGQVVTEMFRRTVTAPDILFGAADMAGAPGGNTIERSAIARSVPQWVQGPGAGAGPGIIQAPFSMTYDSSGPIYENVSPSSLDEATASQYAWWASFDGTTNDPVVYPNGTSLRNLESQVLIQITPNSSSLPDGTRNVFYSVQLGATGGQPPYNWSLSPASAGLPPGLYLSFSGLISGVPTQVDTFDIIVRLTDLAGRIVDKPYSITISP